MGFGSKIYLVSIKISFRAIHLLQSSEKHVLSTPTPQFTSLSWMPFRSFVDHLYVLCLVFLMLSRLFIAALCSPVGKGLLSVMFIEFMLLSHVVSWVRCGLDCSVS